MGARAVGPWVGEQKPLGKSPLRGNPSPESTYLPTSSHKAPNVGPYHGLNRLFWAIEGSPTMHGLTHHGD